MPSLPLAWPCLRRRASPQSRPPGWNKHPPLPARLHPVTGSGMPGGPATLIAATAALPASALAVTVYRIQGARWSAAVGAAGQARSR